MNRAQGLTLIEVVVALTLLATVATVVLLAQGRCLHQTRTNEDRQRMYQETAVLLARWAFDEQKVSPNASGVLEDGTIWQRNTERVRVTPARELASVRTEMQQVRLELWSPHAEVSAPPMAVLTWLEPLPEGKP